MRRFAYMGNHFDTDALAVTFGYGIPASSNLCGYLVNACWTCFLTFTLPLTFQPTLEAFRPNTYRMLVTNFIHTFFTQHHR